MEKMLNSIENSENKFLPSLNFSKTRTAPIQRSTNKLTATARKKEAQDTEVF